MVKIRSVSNAAIMEKEQLLCILKNQYPPINHIENLIAIANKYQKYGIEWVAANAFIYGLIQGKREERTKRRTENNPRRRA